MPARDFLRLHWPAITISVTAAAIACAALLMLRSMPPHRIVMATGPEGDAYYEVGGRYRAALARENVEVQLAATAGSVDNLALLRDPHSQASVALIEGGIPGAADSAGLESLGTLFYEPLWWFQKREVQAEGVDALRGRRISIGPQAAGHGRSPWRSSSARGWRGYSAKCWRWRRARLPTNFWQESSMRRSS